MKTLICLLLHVAIGIHQTVAECPDALPGLTKWTDMPTSTSGEIEITGPVLLNTETERLTKVVIGNGGRLVFDPSVPLSKMTSGRITIEDGGYLDIGSSDCPFTGKAEIVLTGTRNNDENEDEDFGEKFLGVKAGGSLEIHGPYKRSWTKLDGTLKPRPVSFHLTPSDKQPPRGLTMFEFNRDDGTFIRQIKGIRKMNRWFSKELEKLKADSVVVVTSTNFESDIYKDKTQLTEFVNIMESTFGVSGLTLGDQWTNPLDAWTIIFDRSAGTFSETIQNVKDGKQKSIAKGDTTINNFHYKFEVTNSEIVRENKINLRVKPNPADAPYDQFTVSVVDDIESWNAGDKLVIASTDFNTNQAEEVEVVSVEGKKNLTFKGDIEYEHFGKVYEGVDMRAEIGLLTRNIRISGEVGDECEPDELNDCEDIDFDNFGGHTRAIEGFKAYNIEGAEFTAMGQMTVLGSYPIHFHMCSDTSRGSVIKQNSIHHCFSRCVTIHGSHGVLVEDNVAYHTRGHCFFEEDGGEKDTTFDGNLGLSTMKGLLTPSDKEPSTFWITSPLTTFKNNVAAGSDNSKGSGIWYLFPPQPVGPSKEMEFFGKKEAKHTPITLFENNVAHSNGFIGLRFDKRLGPLHDILGCSTYDPRKEPTKRRSERTPITLNGFTGYKNRRSNVKMRSTTAELKNFKLSDSKASMHFNRNMLDGYQRISNSIIVGESPNVGSGGYVKVKDESGKWKSVWSDRSLPETRGSYSPTGIYIDAEGPTHIHGVTFRGFGESTDRAYCGIKFNDKFNFGMGASSSVKELDFGDMQDSFKICHKNEQYGRDEPSMVLRDIDGTLTGTAGVSVAADAPYYRDGIECETNSDWNMSICQGNFARFYMWPKPENAGDVFLTKESDATPEPSARRLVGYTVSPASRYLMNFEKMHSRVTIRFTGMDGGMAYRLGICVPRGLEDTDTIPLHYWVSMAGAWSKWKDIKNGDSTNGVVEADSLEMLDSDDSKNVFFDREKSILYVKAVENEERGETDLADCVGSLSVDNSCPAILLSFNGIKKKFPELSLDMTNVVCTER